MKTPYLVLSARGPEIARIDNEKYDLYSVGDAPISLRGIFERHLMDGLEPGDLVLAVKIPKDERRVRREAKAKGLAALGL